MAEAEVPGGEYPVFEYALRELGAPKRSTESVVLRASFDVIWKAFSIPETDFPETNESKEFEKNLTRLREELCLA